MMKLNIRRTYTPNNTPNKATMPAVLTLGPMTGSSKVADERNTYVKPYLYDDEPKFVLRLLL